MKKMIILFIIFLFFAYSIFFEPNLITTERLELTSDKIHGLKIVFLSDFHLSKFAGKRLKRIVQKVNEESPDLVLIGGDYVIMHSAKPSMDMEKAAKIISKMRSQYGIYTVLGNHDYYKDGDYIKKSLEKEGITVLENSHVKFNIDGAPLYVAGISDMQTTYYDLDKALYDTENPTILISHSPDITPKARDRVDLVLAGHTHGGQVRIPIIGPVIVPSKYGTRYASGYIEKLVYITKGLGTSVLPMRFNCKPEITVIQFN